MILMSYFYYFKLDQHLYYVIDIYTCLTCDHFVTWCFYVCNYFRIVATKYSDTINIRCKNNLIQRYSPYQKKIEINGQILNIFLGTSTLF